MANKIKTFVLVTAASFILLGCSKKDEEIVADPAAEVPAEATDAAAAPAPADPSAPNMESIPGENAVRSALANKQYEAAVAQLSAMKNGLPAEIWPAYSTFYGEVRDSLIEAAQTDPNAARALATLRAMTHGR